MGTGLNEQVEQELGSVCQTERVALATIPFPAMPIASWRVKALLSSNMQTIRSSRMQAPCSINATSGHTPELGSKTDKLKMV